MVTVSEFKGFFVQKYSKTCIRIPTFIFLVFFFKILNEISKKYQKKLKNI